MLPCESNNYYFGRKGFFYLKIVYISIILFCSQDTTFEIYELNYRCIYKVNVNSTPRLKSPDSELTVTVPGCEYFKRRVSNSTALNCEGHN